MTVFPLHRALHRLVFPQLRWLVVIGLPAILSIAAWLLLDLISSAWFVLYNAWMPWLHLDGHATRTTLLLTDGWRMHVLDVSIRADPPSALVWWSTLCASFLLVAASYFPRTPLPLRYIGMLIALIFFASLAFFALSAQPLPYSAGRHVSDGLMTIELLIVAIPWLHAFTYYIFDFSFWQKAALSLLTMAFVALIAPFQFLLHAWLLQSFSLLWLPPLQLVFGVFLETMVIIAFYGWGMSWERQGEMRGNAPIKCKNSMPTRQGDTWRGVFAENNALAGLDSAPGPALSLEPHAPASSVPRAAPATDATDAVAMACSFFGECRFCGMRNAASATFCNDCGSSLHLKPCQTCGAVNGSTEKNCARCRADFPFDGRRDVAASQSCPAVLGAFPHVPEPQAQRFATPASAPATTFIVSPSASPSASATIDVAPVAGPDGDRSRGNAPANRLGRSGVIAMFGGARAVVATLLLLSVTAAGYFALLHEPLPDDDAIVPPTAIASHQLSELERTRTAAAASPTALTLPRDTSPVLAADDGQQAASPDAFFETILATPQRFAAASASPRSPQNTVRNNGTLSDVHKGPASGSFMSNSATVRLLLQSAARQIPHPAIKRGGRKEGVEEPPELALLGLAPAPVSQAEIAIAAPAQAKRSESSVVCSGHARVLSLCE
ncbi:MAG: zinc ribbon domain-containing protein [Burkholderiaceae bacterium]